MSRLQLKIIIGAVAITALVAGSFTVYKLLDVRDRRATTADFLMEDIESWRSSKLEHASQILADTRSALAKVRSGDYIPFPLLYSANINRTPAVFPKDPPVMTIRWLE